MPAPSKLHTRGPPRLNKTSVCSVTSTAFLPTGALADSQARRPLVVYPPRMDKSSRGKAATGSEEDSLGPSSRKSPGTSRQTLPPFREILPPHLHEAIDSAPYDGPTEPPRGVASSTKPRPVPSIAREQERGGRVPSFSEGFSKYAEERYVSSPPNSRLSRPSPSHGFSGSPESPPDTLQSYRTSSSASYSAYKANQSLPPLRSSQPGLGRRPSDDRQTSGSISPNDSVYAYGSHALPEHEMSAYSQRTHLPTHGGYGYTSSNGNVRGPLSMVPPDRYNPALYAPNAPAAAYTRAYPNAAYPQHMTPRHDDPTFSAVGTDPNRRRRGNLPKSTTDILRTWFHDHLDHPYPSEEDKQVFMAQTGLTMSQISNWFINARRRQLPALRSQIRVQDHDKASSKRRSITQYSEDNEYISN